MTKRWTRAEVPMEQTWDLGALFASSGDWERELSRLELDAASVARFKGRLSEGPEVLLECLEAREAVGERLERAVAFAHLRLSGDGQDPLNQADSMRAAALQARLDAELSFVDSEILSLKEGDVERHLRDDPRFDPWKRTLSDLLDARPHRLSPDTEAALSALSETFAAPFAIYQRAKASDLEFSPVEGRGGEEQPVSFALYENRYELSSDTDLRRAARDSFAATLRVYQNTFAALYATEVKKQVVTARLRGFGSVTEMLLHPQRVTQEVYHSILDVIQEELAPHMRRYARLKRRVLGLDRVFHCDLKAPLDPDFNPSTSYGEASDLILDALSVMGPEYAQIIQAALRERWVDRADNVGKSSGAFCNTPYGAHSFILMTWTDAMRSAFTLAHELGHAGHLTLANRNQRRPNARPTLFFIEAPSTMNEMLLGQHILSRTPEPRMRRWVIAQLLGTYYHNYVTHLLEGELQRRVYRLAEDGQPITAKLLNGQKGDVLRSFWGDAVEIDDAAQLTWMRQPHYYRGLYPYTYAAGLTVSTAVSKKIQEEGRPAAERWLNVLKAGGTLKPLDLIQMAGVDLTSPEPIHSAVAFVGGLIDELERLF